MRSNPATRRDLALAKLHPLGLGAETSASREPRSGSTPSGNHHPPLIAIPGGNSRVSSETTVPKMDSLRLLIADEQPVVLAGLAALLGDSSKIKIIGQARNGREAVEAFVLLRPDVGLFELRLPVMDGVEAVAEILARMPSARLLIFTTCQSEEDVYRAVRAGAQGYVLKSTPAAELVESIRTVAAGQRWIPSNVADKLARRIGDRELTVREKDVLHAITSGKSNKEIGVFLNISEATVKVHVTHILEKLKASGRTDAIRLALQRGLVYLDPAIAA